MRAVVREDAGPRAPVWCTVATLAGCVVPVIRPMRTTPGAAVTVAGGLMTGAADERACYEGCDEGSLQARAWHVILVGVDVPLGARSVRRPPSP